MLLDNCQNFMLGFKAFLKNPDGSIQCRDYTYKEGEVNVSYGKPSCCQTGLHFCFNVKDISGFYNLTAEDVVVYPVIALGEVDQEAYKAATSQLYVWPFPLSKEYVLSRNSICKYSTNVITFKDGYTCLYPFRCEEDTALLDSDTEIKYQNRWSVTGEHLDDLIAIIGGLKPSDKDLLEIYFRNSENELTYDNLKYAVENEVIKVIPSDCIDWFICSHFGVKCPAVIKHSDFLYMLGLFKGYGSDYYYIPEADTVNQ